MFCVVGLPREPLIFRFFSLCSSRKKMSSTFLHNLCVKWDCSDPPKWCSESKEKIGKGNKSANLKKDQTCYLRPLGLLLGVIRAPCHKLPALWLDFLPDSSSSSCSSKHASEDHLWRNLRSCLWQIDHGQVDSFETREKVVRNLCYRATRTTG